MLKDSGWPFPLNWILRVGAGLMFVLLIIFVALALIYDIGLPWFAAGASLIIGIAILVVGGSKPRITQQGETEKNKVRAFKHYLENLQKYTEVAKAKDQFEKYLPYAIAFGLEKSWVERFAEVDTPAPDWYIPNTHTPSYTGDGHSSSGGSSSGGGSSGHTLDRMASGSFGGLNSM